MKYSNLAYLNKLRVMYVQRLRVKFEFTIFPATAFISDNMNLYNNSKILYVNYIKILCILKFINCLGTLWI